MDKKNKVITSGIWYTASNFLLKAMGFITTPIFARILTKGEYGDYSNFITWLNILMVVAGFCLYASINRARLDFPDKLNEYLSSILFLGTIITAGLYIIAIINMSFFERVFAMDSFYIHCMFVYLLVQPSLEIFQVKQRVLYKYKTSVLLSFITSIATTVFSVILVMVMQNGFQARVLGYIIPSLIIKIAVYVIISVSGKSFKWEYCKYALLYSWPYVPHLLASTVLSSSDRIMITNICGNEYTAVYAMACNCAVIASVLWTSLNNAISPWIFDKLEEKNNVSIFKITVPYLLLFVIPIILCLMVAPEILIIIGGRGYEEAKYVIVPLMTSVILQFVYSMYVNIEQYAKKTWCIATGTAVAAILNIILNLVFIPKFGYSAAAYTTLAGYFVLFLIHYVFVRIMCYKKVYNDKAVFVTIVLVVLLQIPITILYNHMLLRYVLFAVSVACMVFVMYKKKDTLVQLMRETRT